MKQIIPLLMFGILMVSFIATHRKQKSLSKSKVRTEVDLSGEVFTFTKELALNSLSNSSWKMRLDAVNWLHSHALIYENIDALLPLLDDPDTSVAESVQQALIPLGTKIMPQLLTVLKHGKTEGRSLAVVALGQIASVEAVPALIAALQDESNWVRLPAIKALAEIGDSRAIGALEALIQDPDPLISKAAKDAVHRLK